MKYAMVMLVLKFVLLLSAINLLRPSATNKNKKADQGQPCLSSLEALKNLIVSH